ncbi:hypothetical protein F503_00702 [Ophiostoma piceae UAMH 11346]|uniref:Rhodopsin domain-containing protein n=1 Tax=Ophiostoma piceae (strain UAMH 11346) TaxID=1262450 RepID=S3BMJ7_OPHP1|nr:hypothetical protein F503_00702 [Ophiostoma piceae UAMH 11346]
MGPGIELAVSMWVITALVVTLVALRLYTRVCIVRFVGAEDYLYAVTGLFFIVFTVTIQVAVHYGLGRSFWSLTLASSSNAIFWTYVANSFAITGNAMAKLTMALFLLRVVQLRWHKIALWFLVIVTTTTSAALTVMLWNQSTPSKHSWDPFRTPGTWNLKIQPTSVVLGVWSSAADFFFSIFPWLFIWSLRMQRREKIMLAGSMSLGVLAGICGIVRTVVLARLDIFDYTRNFVSYFAWAGAEIAVAIVCLGIPTLRPLYLKKRGRPVDSTHPAHAADDVLPQFTMVAVDQPSEEAQQPDVADVERGPRGHSRGSIPESTGSRSCVSTPYSSPDSVQTEKFDAMNIGITSILPARPPRSYGSSRTQDSVDEILGLYDENGGPGPAPGHGQIWIKNEIRVEKTVASNWPLRGDRHTYR